VESLKIFQYFQDIVRIYWSDLPHNDLRCSAIMSIILEELADVCSRPQELGSEAILKAQTLIAEHPRTFYSISGLAKECNMGVRSFSSKFKAETGQTVHTYQMNGKLNRIAELIRSEDNVSLKSMAANFGFYDEFHLSKAFKKKFNVSPTQYRETKRPARAAWDYTAVVRCLTEFINNPAAIQSFGQFLSCLDEIPADLPIMKNIICLNKGGTDTNGILGRRIKRRYERLCFIQKEQPYPAGSASPAKRVPGLVDFTVYKKIPEDKFHLFFGNGLMDFSDEYFINTFGITAENIRSYIDKAYQKRDSWYYLKDPRILHIMRSLSISLHWKPIFGEDEFSLEYTGLIRELENRGLVNGDIVKELSKITALLYYRFFCALDSASVVHADGMRTDLRIQKNSGYVFLTGIFRPQNRPHAITLGSASILN
jgi:AraC-like DNA-binding protein